ncbi:HAD-IIB family hydrolase [Aquicoccus sp. SCR17]|nr:HAD-IIB family hydrolase [Carideicomes alvinocaridis]
MHRPPFIIFTDLDGTLLDHATYSHAPADPCLAALARAGVPVILASSKTAAEIAPLRDELGLSDHPAICENGAGLVPPGQAGEDVAGRYAELRAALDRLPQALRRRFEGFGNMDVARVAEVTGLSRDAAALARRRAFSEPGLLSGDGPERDAFLDALAQEGLVAREGGRFFTVSFGGTKADRMAEIGGSYGDPPSLALGDAPNDVEMIEAATRGAIVANPHRPPLPRLEGEAEGRILRTARPGPEGWAEAVTHLAPDLGLKL